MSLTSIITTTERRRHERHKCEAIIEWSYVNIEVFFDAKLLNFSESGVYFETAHDLKPGSTIFLKIKMVPSSKINPLVPERPRSVSLGEVKWRIELSGRDQDHYGVGVGFPYPA